MYCRAAATLSTRSAWRMVVVMANAGGGLRNNPASLTTGACRRADAPAPLLRLAVGRWHRARARRAGCAGRLELAARTALRGLRGDARLGRYRRGPGARQGAAAVGQRPVDGGVLLRRRP